MKVSLQFSENQNNFLQCFKSTLEAHMRKNNAFIIFNSLFVYLSIIFLGVLINFIKLPFFQIIHDVSCEASFLGTVGLFAIQNILFCSFYAINYSLKAMQSRIAQKIYKNELTMIIILGSEFIFLNYLFKLESNHCGKEIYSKLFPLNLFLIFQIIVRLFLSLHYTLNIFRTLYSLYNIKKQRTQTKIVEIDLNDKLEKEMTDEVQTNLSFNLSTRARTISRTRSIIKV